MACSRQPDAAAALHPACAEAHPATASAGVADALPSRFDDVSLAEVDRVLTENGQVEPGEMREWYADYLDACNRHDLDDNRSFLDPAVHRAHLPGGADAWIDDLADLFHGFPDLQWRRVPLIVEDDRVAAHMRASGTRLGPFRGIAPTRRHANVAEFAMFRVTNRRVVEFSGTDPVELLALLRP